MTGAPEVWSDLDHRLIGEALSGVKKVVNLDSVYTSIDNILGTMQGERVMLPEFASKMRSAVFEPINDSLLNHISREVKNTIERWDDRVTVNEINYIIDPDRSFVEFTLSFVVHGYQGVFPLSFNVAVV